MNLKYLLPSILCATLGLIAIAQPAAPKPEPDKSQPATPPSQQRGEPGREPGRPGDPNQPRGPRQNAGGPTNISGAMKLMNGSLRRLKTQVTDVAKKDDNLRLVNEMQRGAVIAKGLDPTESFKKEPDAAKKAKMAIDFRRHMIQLVENLIALEKQILDDKLEDAAKSILALATFKLENHHEFGIEED